MNRLLLNLGLLGIIGIVMAGATWDSLELDKSTGSGKQNAHQVRLARLVEADRTMEPRYPLGGGTTATPPPTPTQPPCTCPEDPPSTTVVGAIRCGDACTMNICTWNLPNVTAVACIQAHEQTHLNHPEIQCDTWAGFASAPTRAESECDAYKVTYACLHGVPDVDELSSKTLAKAIFWCDKAKKPIPTPYPPPTPNPCP